MGWIEADWPARDFIRAGTTTRQGGNSQGSYASFNLAQHVEDDPTIVEQNRASLHALCGAPAQLQWLQQVHSTEVVELPHQQKIPRADAAFSLKPGVACTVMTADCLPLLIANSDGTMVAAVHAGWRGLYDGIIEKTVQRLPVENSQLLVWLGPAIGAEVYEVGKEVYDAFTQKDKNNAQAFEQKDKEHWLFDIYQAARLRLKAIGVEHIYGGEYCTYSQEDLFYSYRRDGATGRMASMIWIEQ